MGRYEIWQSEWKHYFCFTILPMAPLYRNNRESYCTAHIVILMSKVLDIFADTLTPCACDCRTREKIPMQDALCRGGTFTAVIMTTVNM